MSTSHHLNLPYVAAGQAQKHVTVNESLLAIDSLMHLSVEAPPQDAPPEDLEEGARWLVGAAPTGDWTGRAGQLAVVVDGAWRFHPPRRGWLAHLGPDQSLLAFDGSAWAPLAAPASLQDLDLLGVGMTATTDRPLSVAGGATLLTHDGADHRLTLNKAATGDTASVVLQSNWSGRAEIGLAGADALSVKVSSDGATWRQAARFDPASGAVAVRFLESLQISIEDDAVGVVQAPSAGGMLFLSLVHDNSPQNPASGIFAYDVGGSPVLTTLAAGSAIENKGTTTLTGTVSTDGKIGVAVDSAGNLHIENRFTGTGPRQFCLTFINGWRAI